MQSILSTLRCLDVSGYLCRCDALTAANGAPPHVSHLYSSRKIAANRSGGRGTGDFVSAQPTSAQFSTNTIDSTSCPICSVLTAAILSYPPYAGCFVSPIAPWHDLGWSTNELWSSWFQEMTLFPRTLLLVPYLVEPQCRPMSEAEPQQRHMRAPSLSTDHKARSTASGASKLSLI